MSTDATAESPDHVATESARHMLAEWSKGQDPWVRTLVSEVLAARAPLSDSTIDAIYNRFLAEKGLAAATPATEGALELIEEVDQQSSAFVLRRLSNVAGVNALAPEQEIEFNKGLTVIFGENGAGKTGYTRILKALSAVRTAEPILPNVHEQSAPTTPSATIEYESAGETQTLAWSGDTGVAPFTHIGVFDTPAVPLHVDDDLAYVYTPGDLALFKHVTAAIDAVKAKADGAVKARQPSANPFLTHFERGTRVFTEVETLGAATDVATLERLAGVTEEEAEGLEALRTKVDSLSSGSLQAQLGLARTRRDLHRDLKAAAKVIQAFDAKTYNTALEAKATATADYIRVRSTMFEAAGSEGEPDETWQAFVLGGDAYREHLRLHEYPDEDDACLYCRQPLGDEALRLLQMYRDFASDASRQRVSDAERLTVQLSDPLKRVDYRALAEAVARQQEDTPDDALDLARDTLDALRDQMAAVDAGELLNWDSVATQARRLEDESEARHSAAERLITDLSGRVHDRETALREAREELLQLEAKLELQRRLAEIKAYVEAAKWAQKLAQLVRRLSPLKRSLTEVAKIASEQLLNTDFERLFTQECTSLRAPDVRLEFPGRDGRAARRKVVSAAHRPSAVLSEGEQKVIALADFLAEAALRLTPAPLVFDDPVNSLDYRRIHQVADRIAALVSHRQVIVFTHNIWFATELLARFERNKERCTYFTVIDESAKGVVLRGTHPRWDTARKIRGTINRLIQDAGAVEGEVREAVVEKAYSWIRSWCEVVVEQDLLKGVTQRYQANVAMTQLSSIKGDRLAAATAIIQPIFEKACRIMEGHSQPLETLSVRPTLDGLQADWQSLQDALAAYKA